MTNVPISVINAPAYTGNSHNFVGYSRRMTVKGTIEYILVKIIDILDGKQEDNLLPKIIGKDVESEDFRTYIHAVYDYIGELDAEVSDYSKYEFLVRLNLHGIDHDKAVLWTRGIIHWSVGERLGTLSITEPIDEFNCVMSLIEV